MAAQQAGRRYLAGGEEAAKLAPKGNILGPVPPLVAAEQVEAAGFVAKGAAIAAKGKLFGVVLPPQVAALGEACGGRGPGEQQQEEEEETGGSMFLAPPLETEAGMVAVEAVVVAGDRGSRMRSALV